MIPLEIISTGFGLMTGMYAKVKAAEQETMRLAIRQKEVDNKDTDNARKLSLIPQVQWTKRALALTLVGTWCALHLGLDLGALLGIDSTVQVGYTEIEPRFWLWGEKEVVKWHEVQGVALTMAFNNVVCIIVGHYFGSGGSK